MTWLRSVTHLPQCCCTGSGVGLRMRALHSHTVYPSVFCQVRYAARFSPPLPTQQHRHTHMAAHPRA